MVKETRYYDLLGVHPRATEAQIKKAYEMKATIVLSDPNNRRNNRRAEKKLKDMGEAYQVLSDPAQRASYDARGEAGVSMRTMKNAAEGENKDTLELSEEKLKAVQKERVEKLTQSLEDRLNQYIQGDKEVLVQEAKSEVQMLNRTMEDPTEFLAMLFRNDPAEVHAMLFGKDPEEVSMPTMKDLAEDLAMLLPEDPAEGSMRTMKDPAEVLAMLLGKDLENPAEVLAMLLGKDLENPAEVPMGTVKDPAEVSMGTMKDQAESLAMLLGKDLEDPAEVPMGTVKDPAEVSMGTMKDPAEVLAMLLGKDLEDPAEVLPTLFGKARAEVIRGTMKDPADAFAMLFGIELFEDYIGQLGMASMVASFSFLDSVELQEEKQSGAVQKEREEKLAQILKNRLNQYVQGDKQGFVEQAKSDVQRLSGSGSYGGNLLQIIGYIYERQVAKEADGYLGVPVIQSLIAAATGTCALLKLHLELNRQLRSSQTYCDYYSHLKAFLQSNKELLIRSLWKVNVPDIEATLSHVCQMVLQDSNAEKEDLQARAKGLETLGKIFQTAKLQIADGIPERDIDTNAALLQLWNDIVELCPSAKPSMP